MRSMRTVAPMLLAALLAACAAPGTSPVSVGGGGGTANGGGSTSAGPSPMPTASQVPQSHGGPVRDHVSFVDALRGQGLRVEILGPVSQPFFTPEGTRLGVSGGSIAGIAEIQSYGYETEAAARADAEQLGPDGNPPTMMITWVGPPHFYRKERVIALYVGDDRAVTSVLTSLLGPQFAGR